MSPALWNRYVHKRRMGYKCLHLGLVVRNQKEQPQSVPEMREREKARAITSFYNHTAIDLAAAKHCVRLTPASLLYSGKCADGSHLLRSARFLHKELPVRIAHQIAAFRSLPFIVGCNPTILALHELYIRAFKILCQIPPIETLEHEQVFNGVLRDLLDDHKDVLSQLAEGFMECRRHITDERMVLRFLDRTLTSRLGIRILSEHHLALKEDRPGYIGIIKVDLSPKQLIERHVNIVRQMCELHYGFAPDLTIVGQVNVTFPYIPMPLEYIVNELLKNAFRATVEFNRHRSQLPPICVTIGSNSEEFLLKISDEGGGVSTSMADRIWDYHFTTSSVEGAAGSSSSAAGGAAVATQVQVDWCPDKMHGFGFGLPTSRAYAEYLGGSLQIATMRGFGTDIYLRLRHINGKSAAECFRL